MQVRTQCCLPAPRLLSECEKSLRRARGRRFPVARQLMSDAHCSRLSAGNRIPATAEPLPAANRLHLPPPLAPPCVESVRAARGPRSLRCRSPYRVAARCEGCSCDLESWTSEFLRCSPASAGGTQHSTPALD